MLLSPAVASCQRSGSESKHVEAALGLAYLQGLAAESLLAVFPNILLPEAVTCLAYAGTTPIW